MKIRSSNHKHSLVRGQSVGRSCYNGPSASYLIYDDDDDDDDDHNE